MTTERLTALDCSFLRAESPTAPMHVGWVATLDPSPRGRPSFPEIRDHIEARLHRAPRYRQRLAEVPLGANHPVWVDDETFDIANHVRHSAGDLDEVAEEAMSTPLDPHRPLWEVWVAQGMPGGRLGLVGKAHHCLVDGIAAVELASILLDPEPEPPREPVDLWEPSAAPGSGQLLASALRDRAGDAVASAFGVLRSAGALARPESVVKRARSVGRAAFHAMRPTAPSPVLNPPISRRRRLGRLSRRLDDLTPVREKFDASVNDVVLAASTGGLRRFMERRGERPEPLKAMVPASVRGNVELDRFGNRISFLFVELPCGIEDAEERLRCVQDQMAERKRAAEPTGGDAILRALGLIPLTLHTPIAKLVSSPQTFNLVVSNIPGPQGELYMLGCRLRSAYPVVPLADRHALSIGVTSVDGRLDWGLYAAADELPDVDELARDIGAELDELVAGASPRAGGRPARGLAPVAG